MAKRLSPAVLEEKLAAKSAAADAARVVRFWDTVDRGAPDACWLWKGRTSDGYGRMATRAESGQVVSGGAHRFSYSLSRGPIPAGMFVCHRCDNRLCVNPDHLFLGTVEENNADRNRKGREARGPKIRTTKLTEEMVTEIRARCASGKETKAKIAADFGVRDNTVSSIALGRTWKYLPMGKAS